MFAAHCKSSSNLVGGDKVALVPVNTIRNRCRSLDRNKFAPAIGSRDIGDVVSNWRHNGKILEKHFNKVLLFQRGDSSDSRQYHIVLAPQENLRCLFQYSGGV